MTPPRLWFILEQILLDSPRSLAVLLPVVSMILGDVGYVAVGLPLNNGSVAAPKKLYLLPELAIADWIHHLAHTVDSWHYGVAHSRSRMGPSRMQAVGQK